MYNFPNNPLVGDIVNFPSSSQQYIWDGQAWTGAPMSAEFVTGSGGSSVSASHALFADNSLNAIYAQTASLALNFFTSSVTNATSASHALNADNALNAVTASFAITASYSIFNFITSSVTSSVSASYASTASYFITSSVTSASLAQTASLALSASVARNALSSSYNVSSSFAQTASFAITASFLSGSVTSASYARSSSVSDSSTVYFLEAFSNATYTMPGGFVNDPCRYNVITFAVNIPTFWFNTSTYRFTPQKAGYWEIIASYDIYRNGFEATISILKNTTLVTQVTTLSSVILTSTKIIYVNGTTDYIAVQSSGGSAWSRTQDASKSYFQARWIGI